jgi:hypothetical protein
MSWTESQVMGLTPLRGRDGEFFLAVQDVVAGFFDGDGDGDELAGMARTEFHGLVVDDVRPSGMDVTAGLVVTGSGSGWRLALAQPVRVLVRIPVLGIFRSLR